MIEASDIFAGYGGVDVLKGISFKAEPGERLCILGPNGSGKSTLLKALARIVPYRGNIALEGENIAALSRKQLAKKIALLGQRSQVHFPYTVYETVSMGRYAYAEGFLKNLSAGDEAAIRETLAAMDIGDIENRMIDELSGGQLQRVFLARAIVQNPRAILLDEPTNHLDLKHQAELLEYLSRWTKETGRTAIAVLHDLNLARRFADAAILLNRGRIAASGGKSAFAGKTLEEVYGLDIRAFMIESLEKWREGEA